VTDVATAPAVEDRSASRAVKLTLRASLIVQVLNMVSGIELARGLGVAGRGELAAAMLWPSVIGVIATLGLEESMIYHVARARRSLSRLVGSGLALCTLQSLAFTAVTLALVPLALHKHASQTVVSSLIFSTFVSMNMFAVTLNAVLNGLHRYGWYNAVRLSIGAGVVACQTVLLATGVFSVRAIVIAIASCYVANAVLVWVLVRRVVGGPVRADRQTAREIFAYGIRSHAGTTSSFLNQRLDQLVISAFLTARQLGLYVVAVTLTLLPPLLGGSVAAAALPNIASLDTHEEQVLLARRLISFTMIASALLALPFIVFAPLFVKLFFGHAFVAGADITRITSVASITLATNRVLEAVLRGVGRPLAAGLAEIVALGATVVGLATLLPALGLIGAAWASLLAYVVSGAWMTWRLRRVLGVPVARLLTPDRDGVQMVTRRLRALRPLASAPRS
jgi:O-antigen/teichoic acid export membrane protein